MWKPTIKPNKDVWVVFSLDQPSEPMGLCSKEEAFKIMKEANCRIESLRFFNKRRPDLAQRLLTKGE